MHPRTPLKIQGFALNTHARTLMILLLPLTIPRAPLSADVSSHAAKDSGLCAEHPRAPLSADVSAHAATDSRPCAEHPRAIAYDPAPSAQHHTRVPVTRCYRARR